ncbi:reverse transcriptase domain-containing protein [Tanacetum coccineum]
MAYFDKPKEGFDYLPWTDSETVFLWDCRFACCSSEEQKDHVIRYPCAWALIHSRIPNDWNRGMDLVRGSVESTNSINPKQKKKEMYLLAVGFFRSGNYKKSEELVDGCLKIKPNCWKSLFLKEVIAYRYKQGKKSSKFVDPPVTSVEFVTSVLAATPCSSHPTWGIEEVPSWTHPITSSNKESTQQTIDKVDGMSLYLVMLGSTKQGYDYLPWTDPETVLLWDCKFACCSSEEQKDAIRYLYSWVLIHSRKPDDMYRGVNMLKGSVEGTKVNPQQKKKEMYLLAVGYFRSRHYTESEKFVSICLEINPDCRKSLFLKEVIAYRYKQACKCLAEGKKSSISVDPPITSVEFVTGILEAANPRSSQPTWGIKKPLIPSVESVTGILEAANPRSSQPRWVIKKVPDWAHSITPKKYSRHPSEKNTRPLDSLEGKNKPPQDSVRTTSAVDLEEFCEKHYEKLLPIMADKYEYEKRKKEKLEEVKARLDFGDARKKSTRAQESAYSESRTISPRRQRRSRSPRHNPSVFTRLRRERSRSPRHEYKSKERRESTVFKRLGSRGRSTSAHSDSRQESSRYTENHSESEDSEGGHWKSKLRRKKSSVEDDDLSQPWVCAETDPFTSRIRHFDFPKTRMPSHVKTYNGSEDPEDHLKIFQAAAKTERWAMPTWCHMFNSTLTGNARVWFDDLPPESIDSYNDLREAFLKNYLQQKKCIRDPIVLHNIKQRDGESTEDFIQRYKSESGNVKGAPECMRIFGFVHGITNPELIKRFHEKNSKNSRRNYAGGHVFSSRARGGLKSRKEKSPSGL